MLITMPLVIKDNTERLFVFLVGRVSLSPELMADLGLTQVTHGSPCLTHPQKLTVTYNYSRVFAATVTVQFSVIYKIPTAYEYSHCMRVG